MSPRTAPPNPQDVAAFAESAALDVSAARQLQALLADIDRLLARVAKHTAATKGPIPKPADYVPGAAQPYSQLVKRYQVLMVYTTEMVERQVTPLLPDGREITVDMVIKALRSFQKVSKDCRAKAGLVVFGELVQVYMGRAIGVKDQMGESCQCAVFCRIGCSNGVGTGCGSNSERWL